MKKIKIIFNWIIFVLLIFFVFCAVWNPEKKLVFVENQEIYEELQKTYELFYKKSKPSFSLTNKVKTHVTEKTNWFLDLFQVDENIVGNISIEKSFAFNPFEKLENQEIFKIDSEKYIPSVEMSFSGTLSQDFTTLPPDFSISINKISEIPENHRGVKVENQYVTESGYLFTENTYLVCSFFHENVKSDILNFLEKAFADENCQISLVSEKDNSTPLFIGGVGDMMVGRGVQELLIYHKDGLNQVFADTLPILQNTDFIIGNLEGAITSSEEIFEKTYNFKFDRRVLPHLKNAGFDYLMINNNHVFDYGVQGFLDSLDALREAGIPTSGVGKNFDAASAFYFTKLKNQDLAVISVGNYPSERSGFDGAEYVATESGPGVLWNNEKIFEDIKQLKNQGKLVVVSVHDGYEYETQPYKKQREFAEKLIDAGASLVLETHTHVLQQIESYKDGIIAYGLGNFIFPGMEEMPGATESLVFRVGFVDGKPIYVEPYPCEIDGTQVRLK